MKAAKPAVLITGAAGYLGSRVLSTLLKNADHFALIVGLDIRTPHRNPAEDITYCYFEQADIRSDQLMTVFDKYSFDVVVHLAAVVNSGGRKARQFEYSVDVEGTKNVLNNCIRTGVKKLVFSSSGAVYGYHPDNPVPLREDHPLRGNDEFAYSHHKRLIEEMLLHYRNKYPQLKQLIFRPGTILGKWTDNKITQIFHRRVIPGIRGTDTPFVFIWDEDVAACILEGILTDKTGIYNLAGDGTVSLREIARDTGRRFIPLPAGIFRVILWVLYFLRCSKSGPEQVLFLQYRPILSNDRLKRNFRYIPKKTSREVFKYFWESRSQSGTEFKDSEK